MANVQWNAIGEGHLAARDHSRFVRRTTRTGRHEADLLIASGAPLVVDNYGGGQLDWFDGDDATTTWSRLRRQLTSRPGTPSKSGDPVWTAGRWESSDGQTLLVLTGRC